MSPHGITLEPLTGREFLMAWHMNVRMYESCNCKMVCLHAELPGDFSGGNDTAKLHLDSSSSDLQRAKIDAILRGEKDGRWAPMSEAIATWLPSQIADITIDGGGSPRLTVAGVGSNTLEPVRTDTGERATQRNAPVAAGFGQVELVAEWTG